MKEYYLMPRPAKLEQLKSLRKVYGPPFHFYCNNLEITQDIRQRSNYSKAVIVEAEVEAGEIVAAKILG